MIDDLDDLDWISVLAEYSQGYRRWGEHSSMIPREIPFFLFVEDRFNGNSYSGWWLLQIV
jgi:hypothetical protein